MLLPLAVSSLAALTDARTGRIPNVLTFGALAVAGAEHGALALGAGLLVGILFRAWGRHQGQIGGGDVKLVAALSALSMPAGLFVWLAILRGPAIPRLTWRLGPCALRATLLLTLACDWRP